MALPLAIIRLTITTNNIRIIYLRIPTNSRVQRAVRLFGAGGNGWAAGRGKSISGDAHRKRLYGATSGDKSGKLPVLLLRSVLNKIFNLKM
ncbi:MAG: hypothetical protein R3C26_12070 [Calditrichia bacterium]